MSTPKNRITRSITPNSLFEEAKAAVTTSTSWNQGDLLFFIPQETFQDWKDKYLAQEKAKEELKRHVQELLERAKKGTENDESGRDPTAYSC